MACENIVCSAPGARPRTQPSVSPCGPVCQCRCAICNRHCCQCIARWNASRCGRHFRPSLKRISPGGISSSSWTTTSWPGASLNHDSKAWTDLPLSFMKVCGFAQSQVPILSGSRELHSSQKNFVLPSFQPGRFSEQSAREGVNKGKAAIVPCSRILLPGIAQAHNQSGKFHFAYLLTVKSRPQDRLPAKIQADNYPATTSPSTSAASSSLSLARMLTTAKFWS